MNKLNQTTTISQRKVLSQQTRQAIRLLQLNSYDLEREVDNLVLENPLLEKNEEIESNYDSATAVGSISTDSEEILKYHKKYDSLQESLTKQLDLTSLSDDEKIIGTIIIDCVNCVLAVIARASFVSLTPTFLLVCEFNVNPIRITHNVIKKLNFFILN